jgi:Na+/H+-dicarboxylate symporter
MEAKNLTRNILIGMVLGVVLGSLFYSMELALDNPIKVFLIDGLFDLGGDIFVISLKLLVVPLVFVSLVCGASNLGGGSSMGRIGLKTIVGRYFCQSGRGN